VYEKHTRSHFGKFNKKLVGNSEEDEDISCSLESLEEKI
jgi:hypothetical protein